MATEAELTEARKAHALPATRRRIGNAAMDTLSYEQAVMILNGMNWRPRPVFQGYAAYSPRLIEMNAAALTGTSAPRFLLTKLQSIDGRLAMSNDPLAALIALGQYRPVLVERDFILQERAQRPLATEPWNGRLLVEQQVAAGEWLEVPASSRAPLLATVELAPSVIGRLRTLLWRGVPAFLEVEAYGAAPRKFRIVPAMVAEPFLLSPLLRSHDDLLDWYLGGTTQRVKRLRVVVKPRHRAAFSERITFRLLEQPELEGIGRDPAWRLPWPPAFTRADAIEGRHGLHWRFLDNHAVLSAHAPSVMHYALAAGVYKIAIAFGMFQGSYRQGDTNGVVFTLDVEESGISRHLFRRHLDPLNNEADRGTQHAELVVQLGGPARLVVATQVGPRDDARWDWAYWAGIEIAGGDAAPPADRVQPEEPSP